MLVVRVAQNRSLGIPRKHFDGGEPNDRFIEERLLQPPELWNWWKTQILWKQKRSSSYPGIFAAAPGRRKDANIQQGLEEVLKPELDNAREGVA